MGKHKDWCAEQRGSIGPCDCGGPHETIPPDWSWPPEWKRLRQKTLKDEGAALDEKEVGGE